jgi:tRNA A37 threonylcarbamoyladenosine modification protein TsaB
MYKVYIDTTKKDQKILQITKQAEVVFEKSGNIDIVVELDSYLRAQHIELDEIDVFNANPGPGSFTGIKMGLCVVNVLNWITGKKNLNELLKPDYGGEPNIQKAK